MQLEQHLSEVVTDATIPEEVRQHAAGMLQRWRQRVAPSAKDLRLLDRMLAALKRQPCSRLLRDNGCGWIRKEGAHHNLYVPPAGERATCQYLERQHQCPGYRAEKQT